MAAGLRVHEALALAEQDLDHRRGSLLVRSGKGGRRRQVGTNGLGTLRPWLAARVELGHANLGTTSIFLQGIDPEEIITAVRTRRAPMMCASAGLRL